MSKTPFNKDNNNPIIKQKTTINDNNTIKPTTVTTTNIENDVNNNSKSRFDLFHVLSKRYTSTLTTSHSYYNGGRRELTTL